MNPLPPDPPTGPPAAASTTSVAASDAAAPAPLQPAEAVGLGGRGPGHRGGRLLRHSPVRQSRTDRHRRTGGAYHANLLRWISYGVSPYAQVVALCDAQLDKADAVRKLDWPAAKVYQDYRQLLADDQVEAVYVASPDHWHAGMGIDVTRAGKALYLEKPISLTIDEGFRLRDVAAQTGAVVQVGTQQRSQTMFQTGANWSATGAWASCKKSSSRCSRRAVTSRCRMRNRRPPIRWIGICGSGRRPKFPTASCATWDGNAWPNIRRHAHQLGLAPPGHALWASGDQNSYPLHVNGSGTLAALPCCSGAPSQFGVTLTYPSGLLVEIKTSPKDHGIRFEGDAGHIFVNRARLSGKPVEELSTHPLPADGHHVNSCGGCRCRGKNWPKPSTTATSSIASARARRRSPICPPRSASTRCCTWPACRSRRPAARF